MASQKEYDVTEVGIFTPQLLPTGRAQAGDVGYIAASIKTISDTRVGDTITKVDNPAPEPLPGYKKVSPMVFCGIYPADGARYGDLERCIGKAAAERCLFEL